MKEAKEIHNTDDCIDVRDAIARFEELEGKGSDRDEWEAEEHKGLTKLLDELRGNGGDEEWRGAWYPVTLIRDSCFEDYARELAEDIGAIPKDLGWPVGHIDWPAAADALRIDYAEVDFDGVTYWYR